MLRLARLALELRTRTANAVQHHRPTLHLSARRFSTEEEPETFEDFGEYNIIFPLDPVVWGVSHIKPRTIPPHIARPPYAFPGRDGVEPPSNQGSSKIKLGGEEEHKIREVGSLAKKVREFAGAQVKIGTTTNSIDSAIHDFIIGHSAYPSPLNYQGFPRSCCTSVNNIIVHGIPDDRPLDDGDIVNIDITVYLNGYHGDTSQTFLVGDVDDPGRDLVEVTNQALERAISVCGPGVPFKSIGNAINQVLLGKEYVVSSQFTGHGIGKDFHCNPWILHHLNDEPGIMEPGHCFTIEPAIIQGSNPRGWIFPDGWAASTENCARSAQAEHMILITENGADVLTR